MSNAIEQITIAYGSESGNAESLARQLYQQPFLQPFQPELVTLNALNLATLSQNALLIVISSSFGDGEPPENAQAFLEQLESHANLPFCYAIFGLGDITYPQFCGFTKAIDQALGAKSARAFIETVDADLNFQAIFDQWQPLLAQALNEQPSQTVSHHLSVKAYGENAYYLAEVQELQQLAKSDPLVYHLRFNIENSGMAYQAGDLLNVKVSQPEALLAQYAEWFNDEAAESQLKDKELRLLNKNVLRDVAKICGNEDLKGLLKISKKKELEAYLYGHDLLDVLRDFDPNKAVTLADLDGILSPITPRAYSISSCGKTNPNVVDLCIRQVSYQLGDRAYQGTASYQLSQLQAGEKVPVFAKSNVNFHLPNDERAPLVFIGAGTGIAPYIGFLQFLQQRPNKQASYLFFGERHQAKDFLYEQELNGFLENGTLTQLFTAFSRDQAEKRYVQHLLLEQGEAVWQWIQQGAYFYICGSKEMSKAIEEAIIKIADEVGKQPYEDVFNNIIAQLVAEKRLLKDVY